LSGKYAIILHMEQENKRWIIVLVGPPGAGKGTQADLLAEDFGLFHLETSKIVEEKLKNADPADSVLAEAKKEYDAGQLVNPAMVASWVVDTIRDLAREGRGIVFSGSFRTRTEAEAEIPLCQELYGKPNIFVFNMEVSEEESVLRNSERRICAANRHPIPRFEKTNKCPKDGSELMRRSLDTPETIRKRFNVYIKDTQPVLEYFRSQGHQPFIIKGEQSIPAVHDEITHALHGLHASMHLDILAKE